MQLIVKSDNNATYDLYSIDELNDLVESYLDKINEEIDDEDDNYEEDVQVKSKITEFEAVLSLEDECFDLPDFIDIDKEETLTYPTWQAKDIFEYKEIYDSIEKEGNEQAYLAYCNDLGNVVSEQTFNDNYIGDKRTFEAMCEEQVLGQGLPVGLLCYFDMEEYMSDAANDYNVCDGYYFYE